MTEAEEECELQHLVPTEEEQSASGRFFGEVTPPVSPGVSKITQTSPTSPASHKEFKGRPSATSHFSRDHNLLENSTANESGLKGHGQPPPAPPRLVRGLNLLESSTYESDVSSSGGCGSVRGATSQASSSSRSLSRIATAPSIGSAHASSTNMSSGPRLLIVNEKMNSRPPRPAHPPPPTRLKRDVTDVRRMETALLRLLEDFHSGKLRAFGKDCSMEQMTGIREQQERLARLHFELGATQELYTPLSDDGLRQGKQNMAALMSSLEQLSESIEKLHTFSSQPE